MLTKPILILQQYCIILGISLYEFYHLLNKLKECRSYANSILPSDPTGAHFGQLGKHIQKLIDIIAMALLIITFDISCQGFDELKVWSNMEAIILWFWPYLVFIC